MEISIFGWKLRVELLILIALIYIIISLNTFYNCCNVGLLEGLEVMNENIKKEQTEGKSTGEAIANTVIKAAGVKVTESSVEEPVMVDEKEEENVKEGFYNYGLNSPPSPYTLNDYSPVDTSSWGRPSLIVRPGEEVSEGVKNILDRPEQPVPLPEGEMLLFSNTPFKSECCPSAYSNSSGCACITTKQYNYLVGRGGNNVPYSEY